MLLLNRGDLLQNLTMANFFNHSTILRFSNLSNSKTVILPRNLDLSTWRFPEEHKDANPNFKKRRSFSKYGDGRSSKTDPSYKNRLRSPRFSDDPQKNTRTSSRNFKKQVTFTARFSDDPQVVFICGGMSESPQISVRFCLFLGSCGNTLSIVF